MYVCIYIYIYIVRGKKDATVYSAVAVVTCVLS